jgi:hypothetical protein
MPVMAVGGSAAGFTSVTMRQVASDVTAVQIEGIGHYVAMEAPTNLPLPSAPCTPTSTSADVDRNDLKSSSARRVAGDEATFG